MSDKFFKIKSFLYKNEKVEFGNTIYFPSWKEVENYIQTLKNGEDDRPFEMRWNYFYIEVIGFGPYPNFGGIIEWWNGKKIDNGSILGYDLKKLNECPFPHKKMNNLIVFEGTRGEEILSIYWGEESDIYGYD